MKAEKYREFSTAELNNKLGALKQDLFNLRFKHAAGQLQNGNELAECRKDIARVQTVIRQRQLGMIPEPVAASTEGRKRKRG